MNRQKGEKLKNRAKTIREKEVDSPFEHSVQSPKIANGMKRKYIQKLKDDPRNKTESTGQAPGEADAAEQVQDSGRWAAGELTSTTGRMVRQGRNYAKEKAKTARRDASIPPADAPAEPPPDFSPEGAPLKDTKRGPYVHQATTPRAASPTDESIPGQAPPAASPKRPKTRKSSIAVNAPKERQFMEQESVLPLDGKRQQSRDMAKPLKERPSDFKIKERPLAAAPKEPVQSSGAIPTPRPNAAMTGESVSGGEYGKGPPAQRAVEIYGVPEKAVSPGQPDRKPKMAVPLDQRRALVEKQKASPYATRDGIPSAPSDTPFPVDFPSPTPPSIPPSPAHPGSQQAPGTAPMKNVLLDKTRKTFKERQITPQKSMETTDKPAPSLKTRRDNSGPAVRPGHWERPATAQRVAGAARRQAQKKMLERPKKAVRNSVEALRRVAQVAAKAVSTVTSAVSLLVGGGILLTALVIVIVIAAVANSPFGLFYAQEPNAPGSVSVSQAVGTVKEAYNAKLEELQTGDYDSIDVQGQAPDWTEVLAVFAVKLAGADIGGLDVATLDPDRVSKLTDVFWDMTAITTEVETIDHPASGNQEAWTEKILHILAFRIA